MSDRLAVMRDGLVEQVGAAGGGLCRTGDGVRRRLPRVGQRARRRGAGRRRRTPGQPAGSAACRCARSARRGPGRARSSSGPNASRSRRSTRPTRPRWATTRSTASSTASSTSARRPTSCSGWPTARRCWSRCPTPASRCRRRSSSAARCARPSHPEAARLLSGDDRGRVDADRGAARPASVSGGWSGLSRLRRRTTGLPRHVEVAAAKAIAMPKARSGSTTGSSSATWMDRPSSSAANVMRERVGVDRSPDLAGGLAVAHDARDGVAPALVELDAVLGDLGVPEGLRPQVEPQPPGARDLVLALRDAGQSARASRAARARCAGARARAATSA